MNFLKDNQPVKIKKDQLGNIIRQTSNPEYGYVVLSQKRIHFKNEWVNEKELTALLKGHIDTLKNMNLESYVELPGNIIVQESVTPFNSNDPERDLKVAGDTGIILCTEDGEPIYRKTIYDASGMMNDVLIQHAKFDFDVKKEAKDEADELFEEKDNQLNMFSEESTIEDEIEELLEDSNEEEEVEEEEFEEPVEISKVSLGSIGNQLEEEEIQEDFVELEDEFTFDIEG
tara:strand:+ start:50 stop:739 length:690 start_codon:yes stop_codon:yes gene_type:complete